MSEYARALGAPAFASVLISTVGVCADFEHVEWTEDVAFSDGTTLVVRRFEDYKRHVDIGDGFKAGWLFQKAGISTDIPSAPGRVQWEGSLSPLLLDRTKEGALYLVCVVVTGANRNEWEVPRGEFYVQFRFDEGAWKRIPLNELPSTEQPNMMATGYELFIEKGARSGVRVDDALRRQVMSGFAPTDRYRTILRPAEIQKQIQR